MKKIIVCLLVVLLCAALPVAAMEELEDATPIGSVEENGVVRAPVLGSEGKIEGDDSEVITAPVLYDEENQTEATAPALYDEAETGLGTGAVVAIIVVAVVVVAAVVFFLLRKKK